MPQYPASGILFQNDRKQNERQPDYTGQLEVDVKVVEDLWNQMQEGIDPPKANLVGWRKTGKTGRPFLSLRTDLHKDRKPNDNFQAPDQSQNDNASNDMDDEIPF